MSLGSLHEVVLGPQGIIVTYLDDDVPEGVDAQRSFRIEPAVLGEDAVEEVNAFLDRITELVAPVLVKPAPDPGPYDNPEEVAKWGAGGD